MTRTSRNLAVAAALVGTLASPAAMAQERTLGEVFLVGFTFCPRGSAAADGQILPIAQYSALFSLFGTIYGGDGRTTFALPDLRGRAPIHAGQGPGLSNALPGSRGGTETATLNVSHLPAHSHTLRGSTANGDTDSPDGAVPARKARTKVYSSGNSNADMGGTAIGTTGGNQSFAIRDPYLVMRYCVALVGTYPSRD